MKVQRGSTQDYPDERSQDSSDATGSESRALRFLDPSVVEFAALSSSLVDYNNYFIYSKLTT